MSQSVSNEYTASEVGKNTNSIMYTNPTSKLHSLSGEYLDFTMFWIFFGILLLIIFLQSED